VGSQSIPAGELDTVPFPNAMTVSVGFDVGAVTHGPNVIVYALPLPNVTVPSNFEGVSGCGLVVAGGEGTAGVGFSSLEKP
jgi:hypothetical protein